jgi:hypothetical protein
MSLAAVANPTIANVFNQFKVDGSITVTGTVPTSPTGDTLSFQGLGIASNSLPTSVRIYEKPASGTAAWGGTFEYAPGTTQANGTVQLFTSGGTPVAGNPTYASLGISVLYYEAWFPKFV